MSRSLLSFLSFCLLASLASAQTANLNNSLQSSTLYSFESPTTPGAGYIYNPPLSASQPWVWPPALGGIASQGSPFDPPGANTPPQNVQVRHTRCTPTRPLHASSSAHALLAALNPTFRPQALLLSAHLLPSCCCWLAACPFFSMRLFRRRPTMAPATARRR